jgi:hypothetical protein
MLIRASCRWVGSARNVDLAYDQGPDSGLTGVVSHADEQRTSLLVVF